MNKRTWYILGGIIVLLTGILMAPLRFPYTVDVPGKILCAHEWVVKMDAGGVIVTTLVDRKTGVVSNATVREYSRGDVVRLEFSPLVRPGARVSRGDTVAIVHSNEIMRTLAGLEGQVASAEASLLTSLTGQKDAVVEGARQQLEQAKRYDDALKVILARQKLLFEKGMVAEQEYELAKRQTAVASIGVSIAEANLRAVSTGEKREQQDLMRANLRRLTGELDVVRQRQADCVLCAPFEGVVLSSGVSDTLLLLGDTSGYVVLMPVPVQEKGTITANQRLYLAGEGSIGLIVATVTGVVSPVQMLGGQQVFVVTGVCESPVNTIVHGVVARCTIECAPRSPVEYVKSILTRSFR